MVDSDVRILVADLHAHLEATEELPLRADATHWVAEAQAVAADVVGDDVPADVIRARIGHVRELLSHVETTGHAEADEHLAAAKRLAEAVGDAVET